MLGLPVTFTNLTHGDTDGVELTWNWQARSDLKLIANTTFIKIDLDGPPAGRRSPLRCRIKNCR